MTFDDFYNSLTASQPPVELTPALAGLWSDAKGDWKQAHERAQEDEGPEASWVHAYLHRKEGDRRTRLTGTGEREGPFAENRSTPSGAASL
jgi:hypothetical protein